MVLHCGNFGPAQVVTYQLHPQREPCCSGLGVKQVCRRKYKAKLFRSFEFLFSFLLFSFLMYPYHEIPIFQITSCPITNFARCAMMTPAYRRQNSLLAGYESVATSGHATKNDSLRSLRICEPRLLAKYGCRGRLPRVTFLASASGALNLYQMLPQMSHASSNAGHIIEDLHFENLPCCDALTAGNPSKTPSHRFLEP